MKQTKHQTIAVNMLIVNKRLFFDYNIHQTFEAGIELTGEEVKSIRQNHVGINGCFACVKENEAWIFNWNIPKYKQAFINKNHDPYRPKKLLLKRSEINRILGKLKRSGYSIVASKLYSNKRGFLKLELALVTSKKKYDKRQYIREKDEQREAARKFKD